jgi:transposase
MKLSHICQANNATSNCAMCRWIWDKSRYRHYRTKIYCGIFLLTAESGVRLCGVINITYMPPDPQAKRKALQATGTLNPRSAQVHHRLFQQSAFFDPEDLLQLKYETLRALEVEGCPIAKAAREFGLSRPTIYEAQTQFEQQGLDGLLPHKRGPKAAHKVTAQILQYLQEQAAAEPAVKAGELARRVRQRYTVQLHPRTIQKALKAKAKRGRRR